MKLRKTFIKFREFFTECKVNINRSLSYVTLINSGMILFLLLSRLQEYGISIHITKWFFPIFLGTALTMLLIGYLDFKLGFHREEAKRVTRRNPYFSEILEKLDKIEEKLKKRP